MKKATLCLILASACGMTGCSQGTPGGPGAIETTANKPVLGQAEETFHLSVPVMATAVHQGSTTEATIGIQRGKNLDEDVSLNFSELPFGVSIEPANPVIEHGEKEAKVVIAAAEDAALGDFKVKVTGHPTKGSDAKVDFKLTVAEQDLYSLSMPVLGTSMKQGEAKKVSIGINRDEKFDEPVNLQIGELPKGVTVEPTAPAFSKDDKETEITVTTAPDAALGTFEIPVTGQTASGKDARGQFKLTVTKP